MVPPMLPMLTAPAPVAFCRMVLRRVSVALAVLMTRVDTPFPLPAESPFLLKVQLVIKVVALEVPAPVLAIAPPAFALFALKVQLVTDKATVGVPPRLLF